MKKIAFSIIALSAIYGHAFATVPFVDVQKGFQQTTSKQVSLLEVLKKLKKNSQYQFFYSEDDLKNLLLDEKKLNYSSVITSLNYIKSVLPVDYVVNNNTISIKKTANLQSLTVPKKEIFQNPIAKQDTVKEPREKEIEAVVLVGYGKQKKENVTGSISSVKAKDMRDFSGTTISDMMVGKVAGVQVVEGQASPGSSATIKMRGTSTITAGADPLIVVDGFPLSEGSRLNAIDPNSIESMDFLKDVASTAIYGSRGANGVIMIKTKEGRKGRIDVSFNAFTAFQERADKVELLDAYEYARYQYEARNNGYVSKDPANRSASDPNNVRKQKGASLRELIPDYLLPYLNNQPGLTNTDWLKEVFRVAPMQNYGVNITGGSENTNYSITGGYLKQEGIIIGSDYERMSNSININSKISDKLRVGVSLNPSYSSANEIDPNSGWNYNPFNIALISYPFFSPYNPDGGVAISQQFVGNLPYDGALVENPLAIVQQVSSKEKIMRVFGNSFAEYKIIKPLTYKLSLGGDYQDYENNFFDPSTVGRYRTPAPDETFAYRNKTTRKNYLVENLFTFNKKIDVHGVEAIVGQSYQNEEFTGTRVDASSFPDNSITNIAGGTAFKVTASQYTWALISYFSRLNYIYDGKYLFSASFRRDGSSRFGENTKWANFPALSLGWVASRESFFPQNNVMNYLKLRGSWGKSGNNQVSNFGAKALLTNSNYNFGGALAPGYITSTSPNPNLTWEGAASTNIGLDINLFNNLLSLNTDYYVTFNKGLLLNVPVPYQSGYSNSLQNIGELKNWGFEVQLATNKSIKLGPVQWNSSINLATNRNRILALAPGQSEIVAGSMGYSINRVGGSISELYGYEVTGVYKSQEQINNSVHMAGTLVGDYIISDLNGDGIIDGKDKKTWGSVSPELTGGFNNSFRYKDFEFSFNLYGELGKMNYSRTMASLLDAGEGFSMASKYYYENSYDPIRNPNGFYAMPNLGNFSNNRKEARVSNIFFNDTSYLRLRTLKLAYNLPTQFLGGIGVNSLQLYVMGNNLFTWTKYRGFNVDSNSNNPLAQGYDDANYPTARIYTFGLNLNF